MTATRAGNGGSHTRRFVAALLAMAALVFVTGAVIAAVRENGKAKPILQTTNATIASTPSTIAPAIEPATTSATTAMEPATTTATTLELSPLASQLGRSYSVLPENVSLGPTPIGVTLPGVVSAGKVRPVGIDPTGELEVPDETEIGWYRLGARPGEMGATVLAAHVSWNGTLGPFAELGSVQPGTRVNVDLDDGSQRIYEVVERAKYDKTTLPEDRIWTREGPETLVLITCGGSFNPAIRRYRENIVVYAVAVGSE